MLTLEELLAKDELRNAEADELGRKFKADYFKWIDGELFFIKKAIFGWKALDRNGHCIMRDISLEFLKERMLNKYGYYS